MAVDAHVIKATLLAQQAPACQARATLAALVASAALVSGVLVVAVPELLEVHLPHKARS